MDWEYVAGLFDHKGNINHIKVKSKNYLQLRFYSQNPAVLEAVQEFIGCGSIYVKELSKKSKKWNDSFELTLTSKEGIFAVLLQMLPFLITKNEQVEDLLHKHDLFRNYRQAEKSKKKEISYVG